MYSKMATRFNEDGVITDEELSSGFEIEDIPNFTVEKKRQVGFNLDQD